MDPAVGDASPPIAHSTPVPAPVAVGIPLADDSAKKEAVAHWSGVHLGEQFTVIVSDAPRKEDARGNMELRLRRHPTTGYSESLESSWRWAPVKARADSLQHVKWRYYLTPPRPRLTELI